MESPIGNLPIFDVAQRSIVYTTSTPITADVTEKDQDLFFAMDTDYALKVAGEIGAKVAEGVSLVGEMGLHLVQNYFHPNQIPLEEVDRSINQQDGVVVLRKHTPGSDQHPILAIWKAHKHPISSLAFNSSQTVVYTCSTRGTSIYAWDLMNSFGSNRSNHDTSIKIPTMIMKFARGLTSAIVTTIIPSPDDQYLACCTLRGTTHLYKTEHQADRQGSTLQAALRINSRNSLQVRMTL